ncbi:hypothetical protein ACJJTC_002726 [Scirpophaga incertulas]
MSDFIHLNLLNYNIDEYDNQNITHLQEMCICCLQRNTKFINVSTCCHTRFLDFCYKHEVDFQKSVICYKCHYYLNKIEQFYHLVIQSKSILSEQIEPTQEIGTFLNLQITATEVYSIDTGCTLKNEANQPAPENHNIEFLTEVKVEHGNSDFEIDVPLSEIKKEIKKIKKKKKPKKDKAKDLIRGKERSTVYKKYEGKIATVTLSTEEMLEERERDAKKEAYLKLPYKCDSCITGFDHELTFQDHMKKRHADKKGGYECNICKSVLSTKTSYQEHTKRHRRRYECQECGKRNNNVYSVIKHYNQMHSDTIDTKFTCQDCGFTTESHRSYRYHRDKHKEKPQCMLCDSTFVNNAGLRVHMLTVHKQSSTVYSCKECNKVYNAKSGLISHMASTHSSSCGAYCATCRTHFRSEHNLAHHLRTHSAHITDTDKKFICDECGSKFLTKSSLQEHIDYIHLMKKKHECSRCNKTFKNGSALKKHENFVHKKIRPPRNKICDHCGRGFTTLTILQSHVRTHTGERPLQCRHCPATFAHSAALYTHNKLLHNAGRCHK